MYDTTYEETTPKAKFTTRDIVIMAVAACLLYVIGKYTKLIGIAIPIPGAISIMRAPMYAFLLAAVISQTKKMGTMSMVFATYTAMMVATAAPIYAPIAAMTAGILSDIVHKVFIRNYNSNGKIILAAALFSPIHFLSVMGSQFIFMPVMFKVFGITPIVISLAIMFLFGLMGAYVSMRLLKNKMK